LFVCSLYWRCRLLLWCKLPSFVSAPVTWRTSQRPIRHSCLFRPFFSKAPQLSPARAKKNLPWITNDLRWLQGLHHCARKFVTALCTQPGRTVCSVVRKGGFFPGLLVCAGCVGALLWGAWKDNELHVLPVSAGLNSIGVLRDSWRAARGSRARGSMAHRGAVCVLLLGLLVALAQGALLGAATLLCAGGFDEWAPSIKVAAAAAQPPGGKEALYQASLRLDCALKVFWQRGGAAPRRPTITWHRRGRLGFRRVWRRGSHQ